MYQRLLTQISAIIVSLCLFMVGNTSKAQTNTLPSIGSIIPVSPNAASLAKYGEIPVGYSTGIPSINIPVYEITSGSLKMPINFSYHAGGVRVEEIASWVGLGWSLNAGGVITRQARGLADESGGGYLYHSGDISDYINNVMNSTQKQTYKDDITDGNIDSQSDIYVYNLGGESGKFFLKPNGDALTIPYSKNRISGGSDGWTIVDVNGSTYYLTAKETTTTTPAIGGITGSAYIPLTTAWYLTKIINAAHTDSISITYENSYTQMNTGIAQTKYYLTGSDPACSSKSPEDSYAYSTTSGKRLTQITFKNGTVKFNKRSNARIDFVGDSALQSIEIYNTDSSFYKKVQLYQSFIAGSSATYGTSDDEINRMYLDSVNVFDNSKKTEHYNLTYNQSAALPSRKSFSQDHWGYYNAAENGYDFVPTTAISAGGSNVLISGADRNTDTLANQLGVLTSIQYPTGGRTEFEYETNKVCNLQSSQSISVGYGYFPLGYILGTYTYSEYFDIPEYFLDTDTNQVTITINNGGGSCAYGASLDCPLVYLTGPGGYSASIYTGGTALMQKGTYHLTVDLTGVSDSSVLNNFYVQFTWLKNPQLDSFYRYNTPVAGLRLKKITNYSSSTAKASIKRYTYGLPDSLSHSSGYLLSFPNYVNNIVIHQKEILDPGGPSESISFYDCPYTTLSSGSNYPLQTTQGSYVGYKYVQELLGENGEFGKNEYTFTAPDIYPDTVNTSFPFAPATSLDWKRGQLLKTKNFIYNAPTNSYLIVQEKVNAYEDYDATSVMGLKVGQKEFFQGFSPGYTRVYDVSQFTTSSGWFRLISDTVRTYDQTNSSNYAQTITNYSYGSNHYQPVAISTVNSKGEAVVVNMKYPSDYVSLTGYDAVTAGIKNLQNLNVIAPVIEKYAQVGGDNRVLQSTFTSYKSNTPLPDNIYTTELSTPTTSFSASSVSGGSITKTGLYQSQVSFNRYDTHSNIIEQQKLSDTKHSYLWDYSSSYPIVEVTNADSASIAYTSFEADGTGNWSGIGSGSVVSNSGSPTGRKYYTLTGSTIQKTGLSSGTTYIVSYWSNTGGSYTLSGTVSSTKTGASIGGWTYIEHEVTGASTINVSGTGAIDELRLYPKGSLMTTYTYIPLAGMTSQCDAGNKITYYEYDSLGRLLQVKDEKRRILKTNTYQYQ